MREKIKQYFQNGHNVTAFVLVILALILFFVLVFTPYYIHSWVEPNRLPMMWGLVSLLIALVVTEILIIFDLKNDITQLSQVEEQMQKEQADMYNFYDEKGELKLSVKPYMLYYLEAADNYVIIVYSNMGKVEKLFIRNSLKNIEWRFREQDLLRCHRSYIVNLINVKMITRKDGELLLNFGDARFKCIPVSKSYADKVMMRFTDEQTQDKDIQR